MEHRCGTRYPVDALVRVRFGKGAIQLARMVDVSLSGAALRVALIPSGNSVRVYLDRGRDARREAATGYVVRAEADRVGIEWDDFASRAVRKYIHIHEQSHRVEPPTAPVAVACADQAQPVA